MQVLGDEFHALLVCPFYKEKIQHVNQSFGNAVFVFKLDKMFNNLNEDELFELRRFCKLLCPICSCSGLDE